MRARFGAATWVGAGWAGDVYALESADGSPQFIKVYHPFSGASPLVDLAGALVRAQRRAASFHHNVRAALAWGQLDTPDGPAPWVVQEEAGQPLAAWLAQREPLAIKEAAHLVGDLTSLLLTVAPAGPMIGLHPGNVLVRNGARGPELVLSEYGQLSALLPRLVAASARATERARWLAPEVRAGDAPDSRADVWAVGRLLEHVLTGRERRILTADARLVLERLVADDPRDRHASFDEAFQDLRRLAIGRVTLGYLVGGDTPSPGRPRDAVAAVQIPARFDAPTDADDTLAPQPPAAPLRSATTRAPTAAVEPVRVAAPAARREGGAAMLPLVVGGALLFAVALLGAAAGFVWLRAAPSEVVVGVSCAPVGATLSEGGAPIGACPTNLVFAGPDAPPREIRVSADGFEPSMRVIGPQNDFVIVALVPVAAEALPSVEEPPVTVLPAAAPAAASPLGGARAAPSPPPPPPKPKGLLLSR